jgi:hypothetical protein
MKIATATLEYKGKQYVVTTEYPDNHDPKVVKFHWDEGGNYDCDCNRTDFIKDQVDPNFEKDDSCGSEIKLISLVFDGQELIKQA